MAFAEQWLLKRALFPPIVPEPPDPDTGIIIVVPAYDEPAIKTLLDSLAACEEPGCKVELIIIINAPHDAGEKGLENNNICLKEINAWKHDNPFSFFRLYAFDAGKPSIDGWGVGLARKTGMDEALRRFSFIGKPDGVIVSLDADCTVDRNYMVSIYRELYSRKDRKACSVRFAHPLKGSEFPEEYYRSAAMYELHMRYFYQAVRYSGFPYAFHTIGSAFAFRASSYLKAGGMNRRQAGEDFYLIQKLISQGSYFELNSTMVHPSPRASARVPFGTGVVVSKMLEGKIEELMTYNPEAFRELRSLFGVVVDLFGAGQRKIADCFRDLPQGLKNFIARDEWLYRISEINSNTSSLSSFRKRFFSWFGMLMIIKFLNHAHSGRLEKKAVTVAAAELLRMKGINAQWTNVYDLLERYRELEN
jgi:hypothetical protein